MDKKTVPGQQGSEEPAPTDRGEHPPPDEDHFYGPRDTYMHLISLVTLYLSAIGAGVVGVQMAERFVPDPLQRYYSLEPLRVAIAMLIVSFPIFIVTARMIAKRIAQGKMHPRTKLRKILTYFTLFVISVSGIITVITILYSFLDGELTARFLVKAASVLLVLGLVFWYYLGELHLTRDTASSASISGQRVALTMISTVLVLGLVVGGVAVAGLPSDARKAETDMSRIARLNELHYLLQSHYEREGRLPDDLLEIDLDGERQFARNFDPRRDPGTGELFEYRRLDRRTYEVCATFETDGRRSDGFSYPSGPAAIGQHRAGRQCFEREVTRQQTFPPPDLPLTPSSPEPSPTPTF